MAGWVRLLLGASVVTTAATSFIACDLDLAPYVDPPRTGAPIGPTVDGGESGDAGADVVTDAGIDASTDAASADAGRTGKRIFLTSKTFKGSLGGIEGANKKCADAADDARLDGTYIAWLSTLESPILPRITSDGPWLLVDGRTVVFDSKAAITQLGPAVPIDRDERGKTVDDTPLVWTGTRANGEPQPLLGSCGLFNQNVGSGLAGVVVAPPETLWTQFQNAPCDDALRLYCLEL